MVDKVKSTHSDSEAMGTVTPAGGDAHSKRPLDKKQGDAGADTSAAGTVTVTPDGKVNEEAEAELAAIKESFKGKVKERVKGKLAESKASLKDVFVAENLSEDFQEKAATIYEGALSENLSIVTDLMFEEFGTVADEIVEDYNGKLSLMREDLEDKVNDYLNLVVENWLKDNKLAVENGLKAELAESLITGMVDLLSEHNVSVPDDKIDMLEAMAEKVATLETELNESLNSVVAKNNLIEEFERKESLRELSEGLDDVSKEKLVKLTENITFVNVDSFKKSVLTLKESISNKPATTANLNEEVKTIEEEKKAPKPENRMASYIEAARRLS